MRYTRVVFSFLLLLILGSYFSPAQAVNEVGPGDHYYLVYDYKYDWLVYNPQYKNFVPFSNGPNESDLSVSLFVDLLKNRKYDLLITSTRENYLFIEGALQKKITPDEWLTLNIDSLYRTYKKEELLITIYGSPGIENKVVMIGHSKKLQALSNLPKAKSISLINIKPIQTSPFEDFSILIILLLPLLSLFAYGTSPSIYRRFLNINDFTDLSERNDLYRFNRPYSQVILINALIVSACMSFLILFFDHHNIEVFFTSGLLTEEDTLWGLLLNQIKLTGLFISLFFLKYMMMVLVGGVLNIDKVVNPHYIKALQVSFVFYIFITLLFFALSSQSVAWFEEAQPYLFYLFIFYYLLRFVILYIFTNNSGRLINLYLFSYLCVIEIIPLIIGVKFAIS